ncbi:hypothetical protein J6590_104990, partial [Homalodisca vitripennis]
SVVTAYLEGLVVGTAYFPDYMRRYSGLYLSIISSVPASQVNAGRGQHSFVSRLTIALNIEEAAPTPSVILHSRLDLLIHTPTPMPLFKFNFKFK